MESRNRSGDQLLPTQPWMTGFFPKGLRIRHLQLITALEETGQLGEAARVLGISQPAASRMLAEMEGVLDTTLCRRQPKGIVLTTSGSAFSSRARSVLIQLREIEREITFLKSGGSGFASIGSVTGAVELIVPALRQVKQTNPLINAHISVNTSNVLGADLLNGSHDFVIARIPDNMDPAPFLIRTFDPERVVILVRAGHPLLEREAVSLTELGNAEWVLHPPGTLMRRAIDDALIAADARPPQNTISTTSLLASLAIITQSDALVAVGAEVAKIVAGDAGMSSSVRTLPLKENIRIKPYGLLTLRERMLSPTAQLVHDQILHQFNLREGKSPSEPA
ncbi:LysR family transcriptional regulator [Mariluticola halotolerans]|uniref:LysR family transcriptional regulator n=1 Tax=Mariluticola halotolerans TaxID=2909283 RepID=UPI0026E1B2E8|nr:LysR family transcriptional regulator [Mariluticola halotolerans]UJQ94342.1 LysR family transcriptional regulator [Mariluticola halotolerans]